LGMRTTPPSSSAHHAFRLPDHALKGWILPLMRLTERRFLV
jgi:hypothetical protein